MITAALGELCEIEIGRTPARAEPSFWGDGHRWLSIADMNQGLLISETKEEITDAGAKGGKLVEPGTVLLSFKLSIGKVGITQVPLYTNEAIAALPVKDPRALDTRYLLRALQSLDLAGGSNRAAMGATLNKRSLAQVRVPLVPLPDQRRIAAILDRADMIRAKRRQLLAHLDSLTHSIFHEMFTASSYPTARLDSLIDADDRMNYGVVQPGEQVDEGVPLIRVSDLRGGGVDRTGLKLIAAETEAGYVRSRIRGTEILVSSVGSIGTISLVGAEDIGSNIARAITRVPISDRVMRSYVAALLRTTGPQRYFASQVRTVAQPTLNVTQLAATPVPLPPTNLQRLFVTRTDLISKTGSAVRQALVADDELFATLQARAFRGEL